ncbi:hypothetical protein EJ077_16690 [Mesorhizobium sp. M8A.F.Ca.ET.057.01.1.1]|uniref:DUF6441 family protein n=1 Tax=Mesorhizobium sp. M8A.F.Ca.ET.057.01.1.1 TaxID=2493679 RepID=UPI000F75787E|nr:DUF6441 family protein [Mesorhizobium sp. M8A.F.Ca.ET.057.01.1.1]AZO54901.1 hypothetical protein EJ077_16690 [Mesorhizobium sp. M8A.F.Ca.ET.057.01.1.1]
MTARFRYSYGKGEFASAMASIKNPIAAAGTGAMKELADMVKREGRQNMASAGFSNRFQNTFRGQIYPTDRNSIDAAAVLYSKVRYSNIFETGGDIGGKPLLWLALPSTPKRIGRQKMTPQLYVRQIGPLFTIERPGKAPLLAANIGVSARQRAAGNVGKISNARLRKGASGVGAKQAVPLFVGIPSVSIKDKLQIREITERAAGRLGELYFKHLNPEG